MIEENIQINDSMDIVKCGNNIDLLREIPSNSVDLVITSPPYYQQRNYGKGFGLSESIDEYLTPILAVFAECKRIIKPTGHIVFNMGDKYIKGNLMLIPFKFASKVVELYDVKLVNCITWVKPNPTPRQFKRRLVSSTEPFFDFVKSNEYVYNPDDFLCEPLTKSNDTILVSPRKGKRYKKMIEDTEFLNSEEKANGLQAIELLIDEMKSGKITDFRMKIRGIHSAAYGGNGGGRKAEIEKNGFTLIRMYGKKMKKNYIMCSTESISGARHPAIYPRKLITEFILLLTNENNLVLDPYVGSGTTCLSCLETNRKFIGFEMENDYVEYAEERITNWRNINE